MPSCTILFKNGQEQYIDIPSSRFGHYEWKEEDGFFYLYGEEWKGRDYGLTQIAKIRLKAINGYFLDHEDNNEDDDY